MFGFVTQPPQAANVTIADTQVIDLWAITVSEPRKALLVITDHLQWEKSWECEHLFMLQEKINTYVAFIESGEIDSAIPAAKGKIPVIRLSGKYPLSTRAEAFVEHVTGVLQGVGIEFEVL